MNRNEQVNGEKMWKSISGIGKGMKKYGIKKKKQMSIPGPPSEVYFAKW